MKVLLDRNISEHLKALLPDHQVTATMDRRWEGWNRLRNGDLIAAAEGEDFDVLVTADKKMFREQSHRKQVISLVVLGTLRWEILKANLPSIDAAIRRAIPAGYELVNLEPTRKPGEPRR